VLTPELRRDLFAAIAGSAAVVFATGVLYVGFSGSGRLQTAAAAPRTASVSSNSSSDRPVGTLYESSERSGVERLSQVPPATLPVAAVPTSTAPAPASDARSIGTAGSRPAAVASRERVSPRRAAPGRSRDANARRRSAAAVQVRTTDRTPSVPAAETRNTREARGGAMGTLLVTSDPVGARVTINGVPHGRTPVTIRGLSVGSRGVRLDLEGYERWSWAVSVVANEQTPVSVKLQPESRGSINPE